MAQSIEARSLDIKAYCKMEALGRSVSCFSRSVVLGYMVDSLGYMTREETEQVAQQFYKDATEENPRPIGTILKEAGLVRESKQLRHLRTFFGWIDQSLSNILRSTYGHDIIMSHIALEYTKAEMEEKPDLVPKSLASAPPLTYYLAGEGPIRPVMMDLFQAESNRWVTIKKRDGQEVVLPTHQMDSMAGSLEDIVRYEPTIPGRRTLLVVGEFDARVVQQGAILGRFRLNP